MIFLCLKVVHSIIFSCAFALFVDKEIYPDELIMYHWLLQMIAYNQKNTEIANKFDFFNEI